VSQLDAATIRASYRVHARFYDRAFGAISRDARLLAVARVNALPGVRVLEAGVGTGLALPHYASTKRVTGIDLSGDMLDLARARVTRKGLRNVQDLLEADAQDTGLPAGSFDIATAMFVASVVPHPDLLLAELKRLVRPGGHILLINHFSAPRMGLRLATERLLQPLAPVLGWHPDFPIEAILPPEDLARATLTPAPPFGLFTLACLPV
jgi:phosphatidylethanolamine/phosphatidyl-N-methylethanolamine N-methyltransferase